MKRYPSLWRGLDRFPGLSATLPEWRAALGGRFSAFKPFICPTARKASGVPCPTQCDEACYRRVVAHGHDDLVGVCPEGRRSVSLAPQDVIIHEINVRKLTDALASALRIEPGHEQLAEIPMTWRLGVYAAMPANRVPVFLSLCNEPGEFHGATTRLLLENPDPILLLGMTRRVCPARIESALRRNNSHFAPLESLLDLAEDGSLTVLRGLKSILLRDEEGLRDLPPGTDVIERVECDDGVHWVVNGEDKGVLVKRGDPIKGKILEILFDQIGRWTPHETFMNAGAWIPKRYFGESDQPNLIQKHLTEIRKFLGVQVIFNKKHGVRFAENIVKSRE